MKKLFALADRDGDGKLSKEEWFRVLQRSGVPVTRYLLDILNASFSTQKYIQTDHSKSGIKLTISSPLWTGTLTGV